MQINFSCPSRAQVGRATQVPDPPWHAPSTPTARHVTTPCCIFQLPKQIGYGLLLVSLASNSSLPLGVFLRLDAVPVGDEFTRSVLLQRGVGSGRVGPEAGSSSSRHVIFCGKHTTVLRINARDRDSATRDCGTQPLRTREE